MLSSVSVNLPTVALSYVHRDVASCTVSEVFSCCAVVVSGDRPCVSPNITFVLSLVANGFSSTFGFAFLVARGRRKCCLRARIL